MNSKITIPYGRQSIDNSDIDAVVDILKGDWLTQGPKLVEFEEYLANYCGSKYAVAVSNGTAALHLTGLALGWQPDDVVITTPITFLATANSIVFAGAIRNGSHTRGSPFQGMRKRIDRADSALKVLHTLTT